MKIGITYTRNGEQQTLRMQTAESGIKVDLSALSVLGGRSNYSGYGWATVNGTDYLRKVTSVGDSYITHPGDYSNTSTAETIAKTAALRAKFSGLTWDGANVLNLGVNPDLQFYDRSVQESDRNESSGEEMTFGGSGSMKVCMFSKTEVQQGQPVSMSYVGGISDIKPTGLSSLIVYARDEHAVYSSDNPPAIALWDMIIHDDTTGQTHSGQDIPCILIVVKCGNHTKSTIISRNAFDPASLPPKTSDGTRNVTPYGRTGTYNFSSDKMTDTAPTGYSIINRWPHGLTLYHINDYQCEAIQSEFWGNDTLLQMWLNATVKPIQGVITLHKLPVSVSSGAQSKPLTIFGKRIVSGSLLNSVPLVNDMLIKVPENPQWVPIEEIYGDFFDFAGESSLSVYLPFIGTIPLDLNKVMGGAVMVVYYVDALTGNLIARVYGRNGMENGAEVLLYQGSGNCALHIPYCGNDQGGMKQLGSLAGVATAGIAALAFGGAAAAPAMAAVTGASAAVLAEKQATINNIPTEAAPLSYPYVCYIMTYPERVLAETQRALEGWAASSDKTVRSYSGFLQGEIHAEIEGATDAELSEIESAFSSGVIV